MLQVHCELLFSLWRCVALLLRDPSSGVFRNQPFLFPQPGVCSITWKLPFFLSPTGLRVVVVVVWSGGCHNMKGMYFFLLKVKFPKTACV